MNDINKLYIYYLYHTVFHAADWFAGVQFIVNFVLTLEVKHFADQIYYRRKLLHCSRLFYFFNFVNIRFYEKVK